MNNATLSVRRQCLLYFFYCPSGQGIEPWEAWDLQHVWTFFMVTFRLHEAKRISKLKYAHAQGLFMEY